MQLKQNLEIVGHLKNISGLSVMESFQKEIDQVRQQILQMEQKVNLSEQQRDTIRERVNKPSDVNINVEFSDQNMKFIENSMRTVANENTKLQQLLGDQELGHWETPHMGPTSHLQQKNNGLNTLAQSMARQVSPGRASNVGGQRVLNSGLINNMATHSQNLGQQQLRQSNGQQVRQTHQPIPSQATNQNRVIGNLSNIANVMNPNARPGAQSVIVNNPSNTRKLVNNSGMVNSTYMY